MTTDFDDDLRRGKAKISDKERMAEFERHKLTEEMEEQKRQSLGGCQWYHDTLEIAANIFIRKVSQT